MKEKYEKLMDEKQDAYNERVEKFREEREAARKSLSASWQKRS